MKSTRLLLILVLFVFLAQFIDAQEMRVVKGTLRGDDGTPLPGVSIVEKGTPHGVITNLDGYYSIEVPLGSIVVYSYVGFATFEKKITRNNSEPVDNKSQMNQPKQVNYKSSYTPIQPDYRNNRTNDTAASKGTAFFSSSSISYTISNSDANGLQPDKIDNIDFNNRIAQIKIGAAKYYAIPTITYSTYYGTEKVNRLPALQTKYAQGRPVNGTAIWRGPETGETFSWGPAVQNLEYEGSEYDFDKNGRLVLVGSGNGKKANRYNPLSFFTGGHLFTNDIKIESKTAKQAYLITAAQTNHTGIIPGSEKKTDLLEGKIKKQFGQKIQFKSNFLIETSSSTFMSGSPVQNVLMSSVYTTPVTFDNKNGFSGKEALKNSDAYLLNTGQRSYSASSANNPYWLLNNLSDINNYRNLAANTSIDFKLNRNLNLNVEAGVQNQTTENHTAYPLGIVGIDSIYSTNRKANLFSLAAVSKLGYFKHFYRVELNSSLLYTFNYSKNTLNRSDSIFSYGLFSKLSATNDRYTHIVNLPVNLNFDDKIIGSFTQSLIFSGNSKYSKKMYMPSAGIALNIDEIFWFYDPTIKLRGTWGKIYSEVPLSFSMGTYSFQDFKSEQYAQSFFKTEIFPDFSLLPESTTKQGIGLDFNYRGKIMFSLDLYSNKTIDAIYPVKEHGQIALKNIADYKSTGIEANIDLHPIRGFFNYSIEFIFSRNKNMVTKLNEGYSIVPLSGYSDVCTALITDQPKGVIVGTKYLRNEQGQKIIGTNGYPLIDPQLHILGDPNPDFTLGFRNSLNYNQFSLSFLIEFQKGGKIWNGTQNVLEYYGVSSSIDNARNTTNYIFDGVSLTGDRNSIPTDFANPAKPLESNRWYNYGPSGVAEEAIQDATSLRLRDVSLTFKHSINKIKLEISVFSKNPVLFTKYKGIDPESTLWGNPSAYGLDMFNCPSVKSYGIGLKIKF